MTDFERLKEIRERLKFKQGDFAALIGLQQGSYSDVERGKANITYNLLGKLYELFKINPIFIMIGEGNWILDKSNNSDEILNIDEILDKSNNLDKSEGKVLGKVAGKVGYILEDNQGSYRVEEKQAQYTDKALKHSKSEYFEFLKKEIAFKNKIIDTLLQNAMIKEEDIETKVRQALRKNEDKPLISIVSKVEKEVLKTAKTQEEEKLIADIFVRILTRLSEED